MSNLINTRLTTPTTLAADAEVPVGYTIHKSGAAISAGANTWWIKQSGYYKITANLTVSPTAATALTANLNLNGNTIATASAVPAAAGDAINLTIVAIVYAKCCCAENAVTIQVADAGIVTEADVVIERE